MKNIITTSFAITLLLGSQVAIASENKPSTYQLLLSNGQTAEVVIIEKIRFIKSHDIETEKDIFNLDDGA